MFDDTPLISQDPRIHQATAANLDRILHGEYWYNTGNLGLYRPLTTLSYLGNYAILGDGARPAGYHWINLAVHLVNVALAYGLGLAVLEEPLEAFALAAIWGVHPLLTESVTNIVGRADLLAGFGVLAGWLCYVKAAATQGWRRLLWLAGLTAAAAIGIFSKESAAVLPGIMLLYDLAFPGRATWRKRVAGYVAVAIPFAAFVYFRSALHTRLLIAVGDNPMAGAGFWTIRLTAIKVIGKFLWLFVWPAGLSADYSYNAVPLFDWTAAEIAKTLLALAMVAGLIFAARVRRSLLFFTLFFFVALAPVSNLIVVIGSIMAERFMYLPSIGLVGCAVVVSGWLARRFGRTTVFIAASLACVLLAARTYARNFDWHDELSLWSSTVEVYPEDARAHNNLGYALLQVPGRRGDAIAEYEAALRIRPDYPEARYNLGNALLASRGRLAEAIGEYEAALRARPDYAEARNNLANALLQKPGRLQDAIAQYRAALQIRPDYAEAHNNLANALLQVPGGVPEAIAEFQTAANLSPGYAEAHNNLGNVLARIPGRLPQAVAEFQTALRIRPDYAEAHNGLGSALFQIPGRASEAIGEFEAALRIRPDYAEAHNNLGSALLQSGRVREAVDQYRMATRIQPDLADAHYNLANALLQTPGGAAEAMAEFEAVLRIKPDQEARQMLERLRKSGAGNPR